MEVSMLDSTEENLKKIMQRVGKVIVVELGKKYGFDISEGLKHVNLEEINVQSERREISNKTRSKIPVPFCGKIIKGNCEAIRLNHCLYTQCTNDSTILHTDGKITANLCSTCFKQTEKNSNGKPTYGYINDRMENGKNFRDPKGKAPLNYGNVMEKLNISREEAEKEAAIYGLTIPEDQFEIKKASRGRPKKDVSAIDTSGSEDGASLNDEPIKKPRGRPKKEKIVVSSIGDELIKALVTGEKPPEKQPEKLSEKLPEKQPEKPPDKPPEKLPSTNITTSSSSKLEDNDGNKIVDDDSNDDDSDDDEELAVSEFSISGIKYLKAADNSLYDFKTHEEIGIWNPDTKQIEIDNDD